uniref:Uncharacterized protein n=1 Tax=Anguilla anguilla TaxID=7936 RepID=A0A0E9QMH8_ANGAN
MYPIILNEQPAIATASSSELWRTLSYRRRNVCYLKCALRAVV